MTIKDRLLNSFPSTVSKDMENRSIFSAIVKAMTTILEDADSYIDGMINNTALKDMSDSQEGSFAELFAVEEMLHFTKNSQIEKFDLTFNRGLSEWGSCYDILNIFKRKFKTGNDKTENVFLIENAFDSDDNLIVNGDFEEDEEDSDNPTWNLDGGDRKNIAALSGSYGVKLTGTIYQWVDIDEAGLYHLHFFYKGALRVRVVKKLSTTDIINKAFYSDTEFNGKKWEAKWTHQEVSFRIKESDITNDEYDSYLISFTEMAHPSSGVNATYMDCVELYKNKGYPSFRVVASYNYGNGDRSLYFSDKNPAESAEGTGYHRFLKSIENTDEELNAVVSFFIGSDTAAVENELQFLVDYLKPLGVKGTAQKLIKYNGNETDYVEGGVLYTFSGNVTNETFETGDQTVNEDTETLVTE